MSLPLCLFASPTQNIRFASPSQIQISPSSSRPTTYLIRYLPMMMPSGIVCGYCLKSFSRPSSLLEHERSHTGERPYHCPLYNCIKSFARKDYLKSHVKTHSEERDYNCMHFLAGHQKTACGKAFHRKSDLVRHTRRVHGKAQDRGASVPQTRPTRSHLVPKVFSSGGKLDGPLESPTTPLRSMPARPEPSSTHPSWSSPQAFFDMYQHTSLEEGLVGAAAEVGSV